ncbi:hypothetical protein QN239_13430 [Mycolicibacterium sp. Y3]
MCTDGHRCANCPAKRLTAGPRTIAQALPALGTVVAVTANDAALLSHTGEYLEPSLPGEALRCDDLSIGLRLGDFRHAYLAPRALSLSSEAGTHRAYFTPMSDTLTIGALELSPEEPVRHAEPVDWASVDWHDADQVTHLDALTLQRYQVLPFSGARRVDPRVLPHLLAHLTEMSVPFTVAVPGGGCLQLHRGRAAMMEDTGSHLSVVFGAARYVVDPAHVAECWVTRMPTATGVTSTVEIYDHSHRCITVFTQTGPLCEHLTSAWGSITAALPEDAR